MCSFVSPFIQGRMRIIFKMCNDESYDVDDNNDDHYYCRDDDDDYDNSHGVDDR